MHGRIKYILRVGCIGRLLDLGDMAGMAGLGPISNFIEANVSIEGVEMQAGKPSVEILEGGKIKFYMPAKIARISMEDIRVKGNTTGPTMGIAALLSTP